MKDYRVNVPLVHKDFFEELMKELKFNCVIIEPQEPQKAPEHKVDEKIRQKALVSRQNSLIDAINHLNNKRAL